MKIHNMALNVRLINACVAAAIVAVAGLGVALWGLSALPLEVVKAHLDALAADGNAGLFTVDLFRRVVLVMRVAGSLALASAGVCLCLQAPLVRWTVTWVDAAVASSRGAWQFTREAIKREEPIHLWTAIGILLAAIAARLLELFQPMRYDEAFTFLNYASKPFYVGMAYYEPNNHIFHTLLAHAISSVCGPHPWAIRLPAFVAGVLLVPAAYLAVRALYGKDASLLTAGWVAASAPWIEYSTNARGYTIVGTTFMLALALASSLKRQKNTLAWLLLILCSIVGLYTIPTAIYPFGAVGVWLLLSAWLGDTRPPPLLLVRDTGVAVLCAVVVTGVLYSPVVIASGIKSAIGFAAPQPWADFTERAWKFFREVWSQWNQGVPRIMSAMLAMGFVTAGVFHRRVATHRVPVVAAAAVWSLALLTINRTVPWPRHWLPFSLVYVATAMAGLSFVLGRIGRGRVERSRSIVMAFLTIVLTGGCGWSIVHKSSVQMVTPNDHFPDAKPIATFLRGYLRSGDAVIVGVPANAPLEYYFLALGVSRGYLRADVNVSQRLLVVAHQPHQRTLTDLLQDAKAPYGQFDVPRIVKDFPSGVVYELRRKG